MKKIFFCASGILFGGWLNAQTTTPTATTVPGGGIDKTLAAPTDRTSVAPPENVSTKFNADYPEKNNVAWKVKGNNYWVSYTDPKTNMENVIVYDKDGKIIRKETEVDKLVYPSAIGDYYIKQYPNEKFKVWQTEREPGKTYYFISRKGKVLWFDQTGKTVENSEK